MSGRGGVWGFVKFDGTTSQVQADFFLFQDVFNFRINKIDDFFAFSSGTHQPGTPQNRKVMRYLGLSHAEGADHIGNASFPVQ